MPSAGLPGSKPTRQENTTGETGLVGEVKQAITLGATVIAESSAHIQVASEKFENAQRLLADVLDQDAQAEPILSALTDAQQRLDAFLDQIASATRNYKTYRSSL